MMEVGGDSNCSFWYFSSSLNSPNSRLAKPLLVWQLSRDCYINIIYMM